MINLKKAAMFGLDCRALRKQFGKLFLVSRQREASKGASGSCRYTKRAAMFGLEARIALAIFGALSVISGAALYSAIQQAQVVAIVTELNELNKAVESYLIDTGENLPYSTTAPSSHLDVTQFLSSTKQGWKGPYLSYDIIDDSNFISNKYSAASVLLFTSDL